MLTIVDLSHKAPPEHKGQEIAHIAINGRLDSITSKTAEGEINQIIGERKNLCVMLDFDGLAFISTMGLRVIIMLAKDCKKRGSRLLAVNANDNILEVMNIAGFLPTISRQESQIFSTVEESDKYLEEIENQETGLGHKNTIVLA
jgi:anti-sigma B factor antagonist